MKGSATHLHSTDEIQQRARKGYKVTPCVQRNLHSYDEKEQQPVVPEGDVHGCAEAERFGVPELSRLRNHHTETQRVTEAVQHNTKTAHLE